MLPSRSWGGKLEGAKAMQLQLRAMFAFVVLAIACVNASAGTHPARCAVVIEGWRYTPIVTGDAGQQAVHSFVGILNPSIAAGSNITAICYTRAGATWSAKAWTGEPEWKVIEAVKLQLSIGAAYDADWYTWGGSGSGSASGQTPANYGAGFLYTDPLAEIAQGSPQRDNLVALLVTLGYPVADVKFEQTASASPCGSIVVLNALAAGVEAETNSGANGEAVAHAALAQNCAGLCWPRTWVSTAPGPWTCGPWTAYGAPIPHTRPVIGGVQIDCCYSSTRSCSQSQTLTHRYIDCTLATRVVTRTRTETHEVCCDDTGTLAGSTPPAPCTAVATCFDNSAPPGPGTVPTDPGTPGAWPPPVPGW